MMTITIRFFASFRDLTGTATIARDVHDGATVEDALHLVGAEFPQLQGKIERIALIAVNEAYASRQTPLQANDVVAFFPPVSGG